MRTGRAAALFVVPALALAAALGFGRVPAGELFALKAADLQSRLFADPARADRRVVLVEVDQGSLDRFERDNIAFPWPRSLYTPLLEHCARGGAEAVIFDVLFNNLSPWGEDTDAAFAEAIRGTGRTWLAAAFARGGGGAAELEQRFSLAVEGAAPAALRRAAASPPLPALREAAAGLGAVTQRPDADGVSRRVPLGVVFGGRLVPSLALAPLARAAGSARFSPGSLRVGERAIPIDAEGALLVRFHGPRTAYRRYSAAEVIASGVAAAEGSAPAVPAEAFRGAYVIVGYTAPGLLDLKPTPLAPTAPGFEVHAAALDNLLNGDFLAAAPVWASWGLALAGAGVVSTAALLLPAWAAGLAVGGFAGALAAVLAAAHRAGWLLDLWTAALATFLGLAGAALWRYSTEGRQKRYYATAFSRYVSPKVVKQILADPKRLALGGERREVTLFFSDLQGFTSISEGMTPQELVAFMNEYTTLMAEVIQEYDGTIDKYIGDAVMAFWGAPIEQPDHARRAVLAALASQERLRPFAERVRAERGIGLVTRIGINSGECVIGNMGSRERFDYTAIGDTVNQASRLEGLNKAYGTVILVSETAWAASGGAAFGRLLDRVRVKGKAQPVAVHEAMARAGEETERMRSVAAAYAEAFAAYAGGDFARAAGLAEAILAVGEDGPSRTLLERSRTFLASPPPAGWDGVWTFTSK